MGFIIKDVFLVSEHNLNIREQGTAHGPCEPLSRGRPSLDFLAQFPDVLLQ